MAIEPPAYETPGAIRRSSNQLLAPAVVEPSHGLAYSLYPAHPVDVGAVRFGFDALAKQIAGCRLVRIDGYGGVFWTQFQSQLEKSLCAIGVEATWIDLSDALKPANVVESLVGPYLGGDDPLFGTRFFGSLNEFFDSSKLTSFSGVRAGAHTIVYGCGAALVAGEGPLLYVDLPKNEIQYRSRAGAVCNLGSDAPADTKEQYKRFYFVDWPVLNRHKAEIVDRVDWFIDGQRPEEPTFMSGNDLRDALKRISRNVFRARPWFEPGPWGGQWLKRQLPVLPQNEPNYAWSFELIVPENGIAFSDGRYHCEVSFDWLMYYRYREVLGDSAARFGHDFPIRFDFLDTMEGGNLSLQCHPRPDYILKHFGEPFTQDETYYIVDCHPGADVYLGFQADFDPAEFRAELERSYQTATPVDVKRFVQSIPAHRHDLFLIPSGTIHCSGANNMVLEISATPYIFTFKMYDWLRLGLDGTPRPLNIDRAFANLRFDRRGDEVARTLISRPKMIASGRDWQVVHLPTHQEHFFDVHRFEFASEIVCQTNGSPHVLMLVEGSSIEVETEQGMHQRFNFVETFVVPAAAESYRLINRSPGPVKVIKAFLKSPHQQVA